MTKYDLDERFKEAAIAMGHLPGTPEHEIAVLAFKVENCQERLGVMGCNNCERAFLCQLRETYRQRFDAWKEQRAGGQGSGSGSDPDSDDYFSGPV